MQKWIILIVVCIIIVLCGIIAFNFHVETEYVPEAEIADEALRKTIVNLYFQNKDTKQIVKESRLIDSKKLLKEPYQELINMLLEGPENSNFEKTIPEGTKLLDVSLDAETVVINFSNEFVENSGDTNQKRNAIISIVKTLTELTEVNSIKFLIDGKEIDGFVEEGLDFKQLFTLQQFGNEAI